MCKIIIYCWKWREDGITVQAGLAWIILNCYCLTDVRYENENKRKWNGEGQCIYEFIQRIQIFAAAVSGASSRRFRGRGRRFETGYAENIFTDSIYNDPGFMRGDRFILLVEEQATWTANIIIRALEYLVHSYRGYFSGHNMNLYKSRKVKIPKPEIYVIYTGNRKTRPLEITLSNEFFNREKTAVEVTVKMIYDGKKGPSIYYIYKGVL